MYKLYRIINEKSKSSYIGMTKKSLNLRWNEHVYQVNKGKKTKVYDAIRSYGLNSFKMVLIKEFDTRQECCNAEIDLIAREDNLYNLAAGGDGGFVITDINQWKQKLSKSRQGGQPFLGKTHSEETKEKCRQASLKRWANKRIMDNDHD